MHIPEHTLSSPPLSPDLAAMRDSLCEGEITDTVPFQPGLSLHADPALKAGGQFRSPAGRLLELDVTTSGTGAWIALHVAITAPGLSGLSGQAYLGFACRSAAPKEQMIRPCLRSGTGDGFVDTFFDKHILTMPEPRTHVDVLHLETRRTIPATASWHELVLFLPTQDFRWDLHDLRLFLI